jgi:hypothetical protein
VHGIRQCFSFWVQDDVDSLLDGVAKNPGIPLIEVREQTIALIKDIAEVLTLRDDLFLFAADAEIDRYRNPPSACPNVRRGCWRSKMSRWQATQGSPR